MVFVVLLLFPSRFVLYCAFWVRMWEFRCVLVVGVGMVSVVLLLFLCVLYGFVLDCFGRCGRPERNVYKLSLDARGFGSPGKQSPTIP